MTTSFTDLGIAEPLLRALAAEGYAEPTPIQGSAIPHLLQGRDLLGIAQTGTGKTAAFALPMLQQLAARRERAAPRSCRSLILTPTRELAAQIGESFRGYGRYLGLRHAVIFGGVGQQPQVDALARGPDILVATPGRLLDLMQQGHAKLDGVSIFVLDEADRMLDMGFVRDVRRIVAALPKRRQTLLFSATMPADIARLAAEILTDPLRVEVTPQATTVELIDQRVYHVDAGNKRALLAEVLRDPTLSRVIVFTRTKHGANRVSEHLSRSGVAAEAIHGNKSQTARQRALENFRRGRARVLVATDIAARGIDIDGITHVVNFELPNVPESYVHRIGRTARAGASGIALSFCAHDERSYLVDIERLIGRRIAVVNDHGFRAVPVANPRPQAAAPARNRHHRRRR
ncbi:MAG TPA: DEAD/DEAH box helicase [Stellaceae bacterium]|nr:DEAD/DEAH box helicase [Candidatus Binataceae bacterium]HTS94156.1 DEAD/DEAH box helicase [Stellaceae bacterium]